jgi:hypothetical protein
MKAHANVLNRWVVEPEKNNERYRHFMNYSYNYK